MLKFWRRGQRFTVHLIFWPIIAVFVIWGFERYGNPVGGAAAIVNDRTISLSQYRNAVQRMVEFYNQIFQGNFDEKAQKQYRVKESALRQLIDTELVTEAADKMGVEVTDDEVRDSITQIPALQRDGRFSRDNYEGLLHYYRLTPAQFESDQRKNLLMGKTLKLFENGVKPSRLEIEKEKGLRSVRKNVEILKIDTEAAANDISLGASAVTEFLKDAGHDNEVRNYYELHKNEFSKPEEAQASHILIKAKRGNKTEEAAALEKIKNIQKQLEGGASFADLARKMSDDPGSKTKGGDLGWFSHGRMVPEFDKAAFSIEVGKISEPVQSDFGFHLIKVVGRHPAQTTSYESAKLGIAKKIIAKQKVDDTIKEAEKVIATDPATGIKKLQALTKTAKWEETGFFTDADESIPKLNEAEGLAAAASVLTGKDPIARQFVRSGPLLFALKLKKEEPAAAVDESRIRDDLSKEASRDVYGAWSTSLRAKAKIQINPQLNKTAEGEED